MNVITHLVGARAPLTCYVQEPSESLSNAGVRPAVLVLPGGGYRHTSDREAEPVALAYAAAGFQAFVLRYAVGPDAPFAASLADAVAALAWVRAHAADLHLDPRRIAVVGFSAGGHLAASLGTLGSPTGAEGVLTDGQGDGLVARPDPDAGGGERTRPGGGEDAGAGVSAGAGAGGETLHAAGAARAAGIDLPDALVLGYPVIQADFGPRMEKDIPDVAAAVSAATPPTFLFHTVADAVVPVRHSLAFLSALAAHGVRFEAHLYPDGPHGISLAGALTANGQAALVDEVVAQWLPASVRFLRSVFGDFTVDDQLRG